MDYRTSLLDDRSKANIQRVADHVGEDAERFRQLMALVLHGNSREAQMASWPMSIICEACPALAGPWLKKMLLLLELPLHPGIHRNVIRVMQFCTLPKALHGKITDKMFFIVQDPARPIASRAFAITVAMRMVRLYPDLALEFKLILEEALHVDPGPAVRSRTIKALHVMRRQERNDPTTHG